MSPHRLTPPGEPVVRVTDDTLRVVAARIAERAPDYGLGLDPTGTVNLRPYHTTSTYPLYLATLATGGGEPRHVVVKFAPVSGAHREGQVEFANLGAVWARLDAAGHLHVPRPFDYWEDVNALVTEHRPGPRFSARILSTSTWGASATRRASLARTAQQCGEWLRIYHDATARGEGPAIDERFVGIVQRDLARIPPRGPLHALRGRIEDALGVITRNHSGRPAPLAVRHGDFSPDNVHLDGVGICVFDLSHHVAAPVYADITFFLVTLETMNPYPRHLAFDRRVARALTSPFLDGYFGAERARRESADAAVMAAYTLKNLLGRCLKQRHVAAAGGPLALAAYDRVWVARTYQELLVRAIARATARD